MILVKVGKNHHIKLPKEVINNLNISVGDYLEMDEQASQIVIRLVKSGKAATEGREEFSGKGKWAQVAERLGKENLLGGEAGEALRKASREFRDNFRFREPPNFEYII